MGRQSSRLYFQGKDHKDIYYNGHYHDAMYLSDSNGNVTLVWEKLKGTLVKHVSMLSYVNGKYYAVVESADYMYEKGFPVLYEGAFLSGMYEKGKIFGDEPVRGASFIMYADSNELTIIRTYDISERHIARIPINENGADMENISYGIENGIYRFSNYTATNRYYYGNGDNYYYGSSEDFFKNGNKLEGAMEPIIDARNKLVSSYSITFNTSAVDGDLQFKTFDGNEEFHTYNISLTNVLENARELFIDQYNWNINQASSITLSSISRVNIGYSNIAMVDNSTGYILISATLRNKIGTRNYTFLKYYKLKINFNSFTLLDAKAIDTNDGYIFHSYMIGTNKYRVQIATKSNNTGISYGLINDDYANDVFIDRFHILDIPSIIFNSLSGYRICSLAFNNDTLIIKISEGTRTDYSFITIDTKNKTAKYSEIDMYAE